MTLGEYLRLVLTQAPGVAALVRDRVFSETLPQRPTMPAVTFTLVSGDRDITIDGWHGAMAQRVQVDAWADSRAGATTLGAAVLEVLAGHSGAAGGFEVMGVALVLERWDYEPETKLWRVTQDFEVHVAG